MISVSDKMKAYVLRTGRTFKGKIEADEKTIYEGIMNILIDRSMCSDSLKFGEVNSAYCTVTVYEPSVSFAGKEITVYISAVIDGADEWVKLGAFTAEKPTVSDKMVEFTAFDCIKYKTDITYFPTLEGESAVSAVFEDICTQCGIPFVPLDSELTTNPAKLSGRKCKDALGQIAGFLGGNIVTDNEGRVAVRYFSECDYTIDENMMSEPTIGEVLFTLDGISCTVGDNTLTCGSTEGNILTFSNVLMTQEQLNSIFEKYKSLTYRSVNVENLVGSPFLEVGDIVSMVRYGNVYKVPVMHLTVDFDGGVMNYIEAHHKTSEEESGGKSASEVVEQIKAENALFSDFANAINNALGLYYSKQTFEDGSCKIYGHNNDSLAESTYIFTHTSAGFTFVTGKNCWNDGNPVWQYGISDKGNAILNMLSLYKLSADLIEAGILKSLDGNTEFDLDKGTIKSETSTEDGDVSTTLANGALNLILSQDGVEKAVAAISAQLGITIEQKYEPEPYVFVEPEGWDELSLPEQMEYRMKDMLAYLQKTQLAAVTLGNTVTGKNSQLNTEKLYFGYKDDDGNSHETSYRNDGADVAGPVTAKSFCITVTNDDGTESDIDLLEQKVLWSGELLMTADETVTLAEPVSSQIKGIKLVFSRYSDSAASDQNFITYSVPKTLVAQKPGDSSNFPMFTSAFGVACCKALYIYDEKITGSNNNTKTGTGASGITYDNTGFALRYVLAD